MKSLLVVICLLLWPLALSAAVIEGRVVSDGAPVAGVTVGAYAQLDFSAPPMASATPSDAEGYYRLELPLGSYALAGWTADRSGFAVCGRNPVNLVTEQDALWVGLQLVPVGTPATLSYDDPYSAAIEGWVLAEGEPVADAHVYLYLDAAEDLKGQGYRISLPTGNDGYFRFDGLPESSYHLVARQRQGGQRVGPVREGDRFGLFPQNPLSIKAGTLYQVRLPLVPKLQEATESETFGRATGPVLRGVVVNPAGQGVAGLHVFAYTDRVIGHQRPAAISTPTGADGRFVVNLPQPGTYYVGAREAYGDSPAPGELFGMYEESADHGLTVAADARPVELKIVVEPIAIY